MINLLMNLVGLKKGENNIFLGTNKIFGTKINTNTKGVTAKTKLYLVDSQMINRGPSV